MPRTSRIVFPNLPHHITQRGNRREDVFFTDQDRTEYLFWLKEYCDKNKVDILAYCLMTNHIHIVAVPNTEDGLHRVLRPLHTRYAQKVNREHGWSGHLWQGRYFSSPLDEVYMWAAIRYVERNPVRARLVRSAENYKWSSAAGHCELREDKMLTVNSKWAGLLEEIKNWSEWLSEGDESEKIELIRQNIKKGLPCGSDKFIRKLEKTAGRILRYRPMGRPKKNR
ncbi:MAG: transposase [Thermodesulfobacteriota bacterium]